MVKAIIRKVFVNKNNKQLSVSIPKKEFRKIYPTIKFEKDLFVSLNIFKKDKNG